MKAHSNPYDRTAIIIAGPTAVGKTKLAIDLAQYFNTEIISADSRQCFKEMSIGTAVPSHEELTTIPHHFIHSHSVKEKMNAGLYEQYALNKAEELFKKNKIIIVCGGTGLYVKAFAKGIDQIPNPSEQKVQEIEEQYQKKGLTWLQDQLKAKDPDGYSELEQQNPQRLMRALAVWETSGQSIKKFQTGCSKKRPFKIIKLGLRLPKEQLWDNIEQRSCQMIKQGLIEEVQKLNPLRHLNALQTVGYKEIFNYLDNQCSLEEAIQLIIIHTRQYAKRQMTWFRKDKEIQWFSPNEKEDITAYLLSQTKEKQP